MRQPDRGFTLIELMITVSIVGILASLAYPRFDRLTMKSRRAEIPLNLNAMVIAEIAYHSVFEVYTSCALSPATIPGNRRVAFPATLSGTTDWNQLGWVPDGKVFGQYQIIATSGVTTSFVAEGFTDLDRDGNYANYSANRQLQPWLITPPNVY